MVAPLQPVLDLSYIENIRTISEGSEQNLLEELVFSYLNTTPSKIDLMQKAWRANNWAGLTREAHSLKGASGALGCLLMAQACEKLENAPHGTPNAQIDTWFSSLVAAFAKTQDDLRSALGASVQNSA